MPSHLRGKENDRNEREQINEQINKIRYKRDVEMKHNLIKRSVVFNEAVDIFRDVEHYHHNNEQTDGKEKRANELFKDIPV